MGFHNKLKGKSLDIAILDGYVKEICHEFGIDRPELEVKCDLPRLLEKTESMVVDSAMWQQDNEFGDPKNGVECVGIPISRAAC